MLHGPVPVPVPGGVSVREGEKKRSQVEDESSFQKRHCDSLLEKRCANEKMFSKRKKKRTQVEDDTSFRKGIVTLDGKALPKKKKLKSQRPVY